MNQYYEPYLAHWRPKGSKNGMHLFGIAQNPEKYANGTATAGLMAEWNTRMQKAKSHQDWVNSIRRDKDGIGYLDPNRFANKEDYERNVRLVQREQNRANRERVLANKAREKVGREAIGKLYDTPLKHLYNVYFNTAAKVYAAGGFKKYIKQVGSNILTGIKNKATAFKDLITGKTAARRRNAQNVQREHEKGYRMTNYYKSQAAYAAKTNSIAAQQRGKQMTEYYTNPTAYRAKQRSKLYRTNAKYLPTAAY